MIDLDPLDPLHDVEYALQRLVVAADYGLEELTILGKKNYNFELSPAAVHALEAIRATVIGDAARLYETIRRRLGLGPEVDVITDTSICASDCARQIRDSIWSDLTTFNSVVRQLDTELTGSALSTHNAKDQARSISLLELRSEMLDAFADLNSALYLLHRPALPASIGPFAIPPGFVLCEVCGEFRGTTKTKHLNWVKPIPPELDRIREMLIFSSYEEKKRQDPEREVTVTCFCEGIICHWCGVNNIRRPQTQKYYAESNSTTYLPWFMYLARCKSCTSKLHAK